MAESETNNSISELEVSINMSEGSGHGNINLAELLQRQEEQQNTLDELKAMIQMLAENAPRQREGRRTCSPSPNPMGRSRQRSPNLNQDKHHEQSDDHHSNQEQRSSKVDELERKLDVMANRGSLQEAGISRPYPADWETVPFPAKFKPPTLQLFDSTKSANRHMCCFKVQTGHLAANDALLTRLFISTLDETAFEWFNKLPEGSIKTWTDLKKLFLLRFYESDSEVTVHTLLAMKQKKEETSRAFVKRFRHNACRIRG